MKKILSFLSLAAVLCCSTGTNAAVTQTKLRLIYSPTNCRYEVYLKITGGSANGNSSTADYQERVTYTSQISIVVPSAVTAADINVVYNDYPRRKDAVASSPISAFTLRGPNTGGNTWVQANDQLGGTATAPGLSGFRAISFTGPTSNMGWPLLNTNDELMLFAFTVDNLPTNAPCGTGIRLWNNNKIQAGGACSAASPCIVAGDPVSGSFNSKDFNNGYDFYDASQSTSVQTHTGNLSGTTTLPKPTISTVLPTCVATQFTLTAATNVGACATQTGVGAFTYSVTGPFATSPFNGTGTAAAGLGTASFTIAKSAVTTPTNATFNITVTNDNGCATTFTKAYDLTNCTPLAVKLSGWRADANKCAADLSWSTPTSDNDYDHFDVQYSSNGKEFAIVGSLPRNPYNDKYSFSFDQVSGKGYYRLAIIDLKGKATYSSIQTVTTECDGNVISIVPNPTTGISTVSGIQSGDQVKVTDMLGNVVANYVAGGAKATIDISSLPSGVYSVMVSRDSEVIKAAKLTKL